MATDGPDAPRTARIPRDVVAGMVLLLIAIGAWFGLRDLPAFDKSAIGPGLLPKTVATLIGALGLMILALGLGAGRERLERFSFRGPLFVLGAVGLFAVTIRPLGLVVAGPLAVAFSAFGDRNSRPFEVVVFAIVLSALCILLFKYILRLPIPLAPFYLGY